MTSSAYMPNMRVEVAWNAGYRTPAVDRVWTDISAYVEAESALAITYGRTDEFGQADANQLSLVLDNRDARFTWGNAASPYYPNVKIGRPIRVLVSTPSNPDEVRFTGFVNEWPVEWPTGGSEFATASITASSRMSRLGLNAPALQAIDMSVRATAAGHYWPLTDAVESAQAVDDIGGTNMTLGVASATFGSTEAAHALGVDDRPGVLLSDSPTSDGSIEGSVGLIAAQSFSVGPGVSGTVTVGGFLRVLNYDPTPSVPAVMFDNGEQGRAAYSGLLFNRGDLYAYTSPDPSTDTLIASISWPTPDGAVHHYAATVTCDGANYTVAAYYDGALQGSVTVAATEPMDVEALQLLAPGNRVGQSHLFGRWATWGRALAASEIANIAEAGLAQFSGDTTNERLTRYAEWASIPAAEVVTTPSVITLSAVDTTGDQVIELMRAVETAEAGVLHDDRAGRLVLQPRDARYDTVSVVTLDCASERVGVDYSPKVDRQGLFNIGEGTNSAGTVTVQYADEASREEYGDSTYQVETSASDSDEPLALAAWVVNANAHPRPRANSVTVDLLPYIVDASDTTGPLLDLDIGSKITIANAPSQTPGGTSVDYFVEGYSENLTASAWTITLNLSPAAPTDLVLVLNDADDGLLDTNILAL